MNAKTVLFLLLGMCLSFGIVLYVMFAVLVPESPRPGPRRAAQVRRAKPPEPMPDRPAARSGQVTRGAAPQAGAAPSAAPPAGPVPGSAASPQITQLKQQLDQQILLLKKERDLLLGELVRQLAAMPASQAAAQLRQVDDEVASLALGRMSAAQRQAILGHLDPRRARALTEAR